MKDEVSGRDLATYALFWAFTGELPAEALARGLVCPKPVRLKQEPINPWPWVRAVAPWVILGSGFYEAFHYLAH